MLCIPLDATKYIVLETLKAKMKFQARTDVACSAAILNSD